MQIVWTSHEHHMEFIGKSSIYQICKIIKKDTKYKLYVTCNHTQYTESYMNMHLHAHLQNMQKSCKYKKHEDHTQFTDTSYTLIHEYKVYTKRTKHTRYKTIQNIHNTQEYSTLTKYAQLYTHIQNSILSTKYTKRIHMTMSTSILYGK